MDDNRMFRVLQYFQRNHDKTNLHSFYINIENGSAFVDCRGYEVYIETYNNDGKVRSKWCGTTVAAANKLEMLGAVLKTLDEYMSGKCP